MQKRPFLTMKKSHGILNEDSQWSFSGEIQCSNFNCSKSDYNSNIPEKSGPANFHV